MTRDEILGATPEQLRVWVAEFVMGWEKTHSPNPSIWAWRLPDGGGCTEEAWNLGIIGNWVENIGHAWEVVGKMLSLEAFECYLQSQTYGWYCSFQHPGNRGGQANGDCAETPMRAPESICKAALMAVMDADNG